MSLIEQLGGYEEAKAVLALENRLPSPNTRYCIDIEYALLQHRRENNIFEVGDYVLPISNHSNEVHFLSEWYIDGLDFRYKKNSGGWGVIVKSSMVDSWRHATDKEIAKGFRDE